MANRCPDCNKFVSLNRDEELDLQDEDLGVDSVYTATVRVVDTCAECGAEMLEGLIEIEEDLSDIVEPDKHKDHELVLETKVDHDTEVFVVKGRKVYYHVAELDVRITCQTCKKVVFGGDLSGSLPYSDMDSMV